VAVKRFDFANEVAKQLITIASAIITVLIAFLEKFLSRDFCTSSLIFLALFVLVGSIALGVQAIGGLTNLVELQEFYDTKTEANQVNAETLTPPTSNPVIGTKVFVRLYGTPAQKFALAQQIAFATALLLFLAAATYDRAIQ
jgi:predicted PurR-regulated permease PerM